MTGTLFLNKNLFKTIKTTYCKCKKLVSERNIEGTEMWDNSVTEEE